MQNTTESRHSRYEKLYGERLALMIKENVPNPPVHCGESVHIDEPEHFTRGGLDNPFHPNKKVDNEPEVR